MGAWGHEIFEDDTTCDFVYEIAESDDPIQMLSNTFSNALNTKEYLEFDECCAVLVSAATVDTIVNGTHHPSETESFREFVEANKSLPVENLKQSAAKALDKVLGEHSELNELWRENEEDYSKWKNVVLQLKERLG